MWGYGQACRGADVPTPSSVRAPHCTGNYSASMGPNRTRKAPKKPATDAAVPISNCFAPLSELLARFRSTSPSPAPSCLQAPDQDAERLSSAQLTSVQHLQYSEHASSSSPASFIDEDLQHPAVSGEHPDLPVSECQSGANGVGRHPYPPYLLKCCNHLTTMWLPLPAHPRVP